MQCRSFLLLAAVAAVLAAAPACDDFAPPSALSTSQVVGVIAEPPIVAPGATTVLTPLIATPTGPLTGSATVSATWTLTETLPGVAPFGEVIARPDGTAQYRAPMVVPPLPPNAPPLDSVQLTAVLDGRTVTTLKAVLVAGVPTANPVISALSADGIAVGEALTLDAGAELALEVRTTPAAGDNARFAWYSSIGEIEKYQNNPTTLLAEEPGQGWLYVVVRDGQLGVAWRAIPVTVR